jgi:hypothetical protein
VPTVVDPHRHSRAVVILAVLTVLLGAELGTRALAHRLPAPRTWSTPEAQVKVAQMERRRAGGRTGGTVFVGTSLMEAAADPTRYPGDSYNASLAGLGLRTLRWWTANVVVPDLRPATVVLGLTTRELNANDAGRNALEDAFFDAPAVRRLTGRERPLDAADRIAGRLSELVRYRRVLRRPSVLFERDPDGVDGDIEFDAGGAATFFRHATFDAGPAAERSVRATALHQFRVGERELDELRAMITELRRAGTRVVVVDMPVSDVYPRWHPGGEATYRAAARRLDTTARAAGAEVLRPGVWPESLFADPFHLNGAGTARFTALLAQEVQR